MSQETFLDILIRLEAFKRIIVFRPKIDFFPRGKSTAFFSKMTKFSSRHFLILHVPRDISVS